MSSAPAMIDVMQELCATGDPSTALTVLAVLWPCPKPPAEYTGFFIRAKFASRDSGRPNIPDAVLGSAEAEIARFVSGVPATRLDEFDQHVRRLGRWRWAVGPNHMKECGCADPPRPNDLPEGAGRTSQLCLLACHADGHVREAAVAELGSAPEPVAFRFLALRAMDWVPQVAERAAVAAAAFMSASPNDILEALPLLPRLLRSSRLPAQRLAEAIATSVKAPGQRRVLQSAIDSPDRYISRIGAQLAFDCEGTPERALVEAVLRCRDTPTRRYALLWEPRLRQSCPELAAELRTALLGDTAAGLRAGALRAHVDVQGPDDVLYAALLDLSATVRSIAQFHLRPFCSRSQLLDLYRAVIARGVHAGGAPLNQIAAAAAGLGEFGEAADTPALVGLLASPSRVARAALRAIAKLDPVGAHPLLLRSLADHRPGIQREALRLLDRRLPDTDASELRDGWRSRMASDRRALVQAMLRLSSWVSLQLLLEAASDAPALAEEALMHWRPDTRRGYVPLHPSPEVGRTLRAELQRARLLLSPEATNRIDGELRRWAGV